MTADELRAALEVELAWRQEELAFFKNQLSEIAEENKNKYRKSLVLICNDFKIRYAIGDGL